MGVRSVISLSVVLLFAHGVALQFEGVRVVNEAVQDGVAHGGITDEFVPGVDGVLAGDQRGAGPLSVIEDLEEQAVLVRFERGEAPVVNDE